MNTHNNMMENSQEDDTDNNLRPINFDDDDEDGNDSGHEQHFNSVRNRGVAQ